MANNNAEDYINATLKVIREVIVGLLSWLLKLCGGNISSEKQEESGTSQIDHDASIEYDQKFKILQSKIEGLNKTVRDLQSKLGETREEVTDLHKRLNSITGEYQADMENMRKELTSEIKNQLANVYENTNHETKPIEVSSLYFEPSSDGKMLINVMETNPLSSNFIELSPSNGMFSIVQSEKCVDYILANRDYALGACEVHINSASPLSVCVDDKGYAERIDGSKDWKVIRKAKITLR